MNHDTKPGRQAAYSSKGIDKKKSYHLAGHAAAIYLANKEKNLPAVHFQLNCKRLIRDQDAPCFSKETDNYSVLIEGGRLIQSLPMAFAVAIRYFSKAQQEQYRCSLEADVVNLLAGALAEAKYVALCDDELFTPNLVNLGALRYYGGKSDLELIDEYMECYLLGRDERESKLKELFLEAHNFVNKRLNWRAITRLADYIRQENKAVISCEEVISLLRPFSNKIVQADNFYFGKTFDSALISS